jgi:hypothetical protein
VPPEHAVRDSTAAALAAASTLVEALLEVTVGVSLVRLEIQGFSTLPSLSHRGVLGIPDMVH